MLLGLGARIGFLDFGAGTGVWFLGLGGGADEVVNILSSCCLNIFL